MGVISWTNKKQRNQGDDFKAMTLNSQDKHVLRGLGELLGDSVA